MADVPTLPPIRGRDAHLALIHQRLDELRAGTGAVIVIEGAPGFGKTRVLQDAYYRGAAMGIRGGHGMADPIDQVVDLAPLLEALFDNEPPMLDKAALNVVHAAPEQRFWLLHDLETLLEQAALSGPLLLCLDDLHWADSGTAAALRTLPRRLASLPIAWFLATRAGQGSAQIRTALAEVVAGGADRLQLGPLSDAAVAQVVADILDAEPDAELLRSAQQTPLFRERDRDSMKARFDLWSLDDVRANASRILNVLQEGRMPCDGTWPPDQVETLRQWIDGGMAP